MTPIFDIDLLYGEISDLWTQIADLKEHPILKNTKEYYQLNNLRDQEKRLGELIRLGTALDTGHMDPALGDLRVATNPDVLIYSGELLKYISPGKSVWEAALTLTPGAYWGEHALALTYRGEKGAFIHYQGMRYQVRETFVAFDKELLPGELQIEKHMLSQGQRCGFHGPVFRSQPIYIPEKADAKDLVSLVAGYIHRHIAISDGFLPWDKDPNLLQKLAGLANPDWSTN